MSPTDIHKVARLDPSIPREAAVVMMQRTVVGVLIAGVGVVGVVRGGMNDYLAAGMIVLGATVWSTRVVVGAMRALVEPLAGLFGAIRGKGNADQS